MTTDTPSRTPTQINWFFPDESLVHVFDHSLPEYASVKSVHVTTTIGTDVAVETLANEIEHMKLSSQGESCLVTFDNLPGTASLYTTGKICLMGEITSARKIQTFFARLHTLLREHGVDTEWNPITITNLVVHFESDTQPAFRNRDESKKLNLNAINLAIEQAIYDPQKFPGVTIRINESETTSEDEVLLFSNGAIIVHANTTKQALEHRNQVIEELDELGLID